MSAASEQLAAARSSAPRRRSPLVDGLLRWGLVVAVLLVVWHALTVVTGVPRYILPGPSRVLARLLADFDLLLPHLGVTALEIVLGLALGVALGVSSALLIAHTPAARRWLLPVLVASQAIPVFALAPLLTLWFGYGIGSKVAMAALIIFFPVTAAFLDGLRRTPPGWLELARVMTRGSAHPARARLAIFARVRIPAALPALGSGLRVATAVAPIGAVVGEWVGASAGLGYLMLHANGRMQTDLMFAALALLAAFSIVLWFCVDALLRRALPWQPDALD